MVLKPSEFRFSIKASDKSREEKAELGIENYRRNVCTLKKVDYRIRSKSSWSRLTLKLVN